MEPEGLSLPFKNLKPGAKVKFKQPDGSEVDMGFIAHDGGLTGDAPSADELIKAVDGQTPSMWDGWVDLGYLDDATVVNYTWVGSEEAHKLPIGKSMIESTDGVAAYFAAVSKAMAKMAAAEMPAYSWAGPPAQSGPSNSQLVGMLARRIPGMRERVCCPHPGCDVGSSVDRVVIHLNDYHRWAREMIADWLDTLSIDLTVQDEPEGRHAVYGVIHWTYTPHNFTIRFQVAIPGADYDLMFDLPVSGFPTWLPDRLDAKLRYLEGMELDTQFVLGVPPPGEETWEVEELSPDSPTPAPYTVVVHKVPYTPCDQPVGTVREALIRGGFAS